MTGDDGMEVLDLDMELDEHALRRVSEALTRLLHHRQHLAAVHRTAAMWDDARDKQVRRGPREACEHSL